VVDETFAPYNVRIYYQSHISEGMFVQNEKFVEAHESRIDDVSLHGQESNSTTRRLAMTNLAVRGIEWDLGPVYADTFRRDLHKDLKADYVLANPPFNDSGWHRDDEDVRWKYGLSPKGNANFAWVQHFIVDWELENTEHGLL
jgi:type I restriction enzyme M protein